MASQLREVLNHFVDQSTPMSINHLAREMDLDVGVLHGMIDYWVRKGKLRAVGSDNQTCNTCGIKGACPFVVTLPRYYELVRDDDSTSEPPCTCGGRCTA